MTRTTSYTNAAQQRLLQLIDLLAGHELAGLAPTEIARALGCTAPVVTRDLDNLRTAGWAELHPAIADQPYDKVVDSLTDEVTGATVAAIATTASRSTPTRPCRKSSIMPRTVSMIVYATTMMTIHWPTPGLPSTGISAAPHGRHDGHTASGMTVSTAIGNSGT